VVFADGFVARFQIDGPLDTLVVQAGLQAEPAGSFVQDATDFFMVDAVELPFPELPRG
jgi:hypothetical protein